MMDNGRATADFPQENNSKPVPTTGETYWPVAETMREKIARAAYEGEHRGLSNCYAWEDEWEPYQEPERARYYKIADAVLALIEPVMEENRSLQIQRLTILGMVYAIAPKTVTSICRDIDPSGALLADVREVDARATLSPKSEKQDG